MLGFTAVHAEPIDAAARGPIPDLLARVEQDRFEDLLDPVAPLYLRRRHTVSTVAVRAASLRAAQLRRLVEFRIAQYARIGFCDPVKLGAALTTNAPLTSADDEDVHVVALGADGRLLCSAVLRALPGVTETARMGDPGRPLFPVEQVHGRGVFDRLRILPDLPVRRVRELSGFVKDATLHSLGELSARGSTEVATAIFRLPLLEPFAACVDALVGDLEETVAKANMDFFGVPVSTLPGTVPRLPDTSFLAPRYATRTVRPFAYLVDDQDPALDRLAAVEAALELPGLACLIELVRLSRTPLDPPPSALTPHFAASAAARARRRRPTPPPPCARPGGPDLEPTTRRGTA
jgi:hypothetical protein